MALIGLFAVGLSGYALITGQGGAWVDSMGSKTPASPLATRTVAVIGLIAGLFIICLAASLGFAAAMGLLTGYQ
ncbi:MAG: hypothetical protein Kow00124_31410 [Anaerolineae bacterium]